MSSYFYHLLCEVLSIHAVMLETNLQRCIIFHFSSFHVDQEHFQLVQSEDQETAV